MYRSRSSEKSEKVEKYSKEVHEDGRGLGRRSRKTVPVQTEYGEYNSHTHSGPIHARQAWSGDERIRLPRRDILSKKEKHQLHHQRNGDMSLEDWEYGGQGQELPLQYVRSDPRADDIGPRWQLMQHQRHQQEQQQKGQENSLRRTVGYIGQHPLPGENKFLRRYAGEDQDQAYLLEPHRSQPYGYLTGDVDSRSERKLVRQAHYVQQRSPPHSLPPATTEYRMQSETKLPQTRFYR